MKTLAPRTHAIVGPRSSGCLASVLASLLACLALGQVARPVQTLDAGGGRSTSGNATVDTSLGGLGGVSTVINGATQDLLNKSGFAGQLYDVAHLDLTSTLDLLLPGQTTQLGGIALGDDGSQVQLVGPDISWSSPEFPIVSLSPDGKATVTPVTSLIRSNQLAFFEGTYSGVLASLSVQVVPTEKPLIRSAPLSLTTNEGATVSFAVEAAGIEPLVYQWSLRDDLLPSETNTVLTLTSVSTNDAGLYTVQVSNPYGVALSSATLALHGEETHPRILSRPPESISATLESVVTLAVEVEGTPPYSYQWRLNGQNLVNRPDGTDLETLIERGILYGATNDTLTITNVQLADAGTYSVVVTDALGSVLIDPIALTIAGLAPVPDEISSAAGNGVSNNVEATPVRWTWRPPITGIATVTTAGSGFDSIVTVNALADPLTITAADDDAGGFRTSLVRFNVIADQAYDIVVDGFAGATGDILLQWAANETPAILPKITEQPESVWLLYSTNVVLGQAVVLSVGVQASPDATYVWYHNGNPLSDADGPTLTITNVTRAEIGQYHLAVFEPGLDPVFSGVAQIEAGDLAGVFSGDGPKALYDQSGAILTNKVLVLNLLETFIPGSGDSPGGADRVRPASVAQGIISGTQLTASSEDENIKYIALKTDVEATVTLDSGGSRLASGVKPGVFVGTGPAYAYGSYQSLGLTNIAAGEDKPYTVQFEGKPAIQYWVETFPPDGSAGELQLNWTAAVIGVEDFKSFLLVATSHVTAVIYHAKNGIEKISGVFSQVRTARARSTVNLFTKVDFSVSADKTRSTFNMDSDHDYWVIVKYPPGAVQLDSLVWDTAAPPGVTPSLVITNIPNFVVLGWVGTDWRLQVTNQLDFDVNYWGDVPPTNNRIQFPLNEDSQFFRLVPLPW